MLRGRVTIDQSAEAKLFAALAKVPEVGARAGAEVLRANVSSTSHGRGRQYARLPNRSSAPGQMPVSQSGQRGIAGAVRAKRLSPFYWVFGLEPKTSDQARQFLALEKGAPRNNLAPRSPVLRTALDTRTQQTMLAAIQRAL